MNRNLAAGLTALMITGALVAAAQPSYYDSRARQNAEYKNLSNATNRAYSVPDRAGSAPASKSSSSSSTYSGGSRSSGASASPMRSNAPECKPPAKVEKTNAEVIAEHNAWLRKVRAEEESERNAWKSNYSAEVKVAEQQRNAYAHELARAPEVRALADKIEASGFTATEAFAMAYRIVPQATGVAPVSEKEVTYLKESEKALRRFAERRATASYEELRELSNLFMTASVTAINANQSIAARFPERTRDTELREIGCMPFIWGGTRTWNTSVQADRATEGEKREVVDRYRELAARYPEQAKAMLESLNSEASARLNAALASGK